MNEPHDRKPATERRDFLRKAGAVSTHDAGPGRGAHRRLGGRLGRAREEGSQDRLHPAHRLLVGRDGVGHGVRQEVRHQDHPEQGGVLGRGARQAGERRARRGARALRPHLRRAAGHRRAEEGHGRPDEPQPQRPGDHAVREAAREGRQGRREPEGAHRPGRSATTRSRRPSRPARTRCGSTTGSRRSGINPFTDVKTITVPPPQMVANMRVGNMDGFCVGEPWNNRAIVDKIGFTAETTQGIWKDHPEKTLGTHRRVRAEVSEHRARDDRGGHRRRPLDRRLALQPPEDRRDRSPTSPTSTPTRT